MDLLDEQEGRVDQHDAGRVAEPWSITAVISGDMAASQSLTPVPLRAARAGQMLIDRGNVC